MTLENDWERVRKIFEQVKVNHWNNSLIYSVEIYDLRKYDRGIDYPLRRLLDSEEYGHRIRVFGCPSSQFDRHPFRWDEKVWSCIRIKEFLNPPDMEFVKRILQEKPKSQPEAKILWEKYNSESDKRTDGANPGFCNICGKKLIDLSHIFKGLSAQVCDGHGMRPIMTGQTMTAKEFFRSR